MLLNVDIVHVNILQIYTIDKILVERILFGFDSKILKSKIFQMYIRINGYIKENLAFQINISQSNIFRVGDRFILSSFQIEELCPGFYVQQAKCLSFNIFYRDELIFQFVKCLVI